MPSAWGDSWGDSWGESWGTRAVPARTGGGHHPSQGYTGYETRRRTPEEVRREREDFGILPRRIIADVAARQAERLEQDAQKQYDELQRELQLQGIEWDARYLAALADLRERLIGEEIARRLQMQLNNEATMMLLVMAAVA